MATKRMPIPFLRWFRIFGLMGNATFDQKGGVYTSMGDLRAIAWRAYRKGKKDEKELWNRGKERPSRWKAPG